MFAIPSRADIIAVAAQYGFHVDDDSVAEWQAFLAARLETLDRFVQERTDGDRPPLLFPERGPGHRPSAAEDPSNAWLWKCAIGGKDTGLLAGRTVSFKDHVAVAGIPITFNAFALNGLISDIDATVVTRILDAGATVIGKNTMFGLSGGRSLGGYVGDYWEAINPHDPERTTGGSSSGSAVAVATGEVDIAIAGDQGGSIRLPAAYCGIVGLKPTFGLVPHMGATFGSEPSIDHLGPMARTIEDVAAALQAIAGHDDYDPRQGWEVPASVDALSGLGDGVRGLRIGLLEEGFEDPIDAEVRDGVLAALDALSAAGAVVTRVSVPEHRSVHLAAGTLAVEGAWAIRTLGPFGAGARNYYPETITAAVNRMWATEGDLISTHTKANVLLTEFSRRNFHGATYAKAQNLRAGFVRAYDRALADVDILALPTSATVAPLLPERVSHREGLARELEDLRGGYADTVRHTRPFSYTGHPALAVPCGKVGGLPISLQLVGRRFEDPVLLRAGYALQQAIGREPEPR
ncbi:amidase family protein [Microbacterium sp. X-17]|uniref:amidase family protein n=1 Tax=Microbacterium sp. X-17 TaxID=3144404 RepID=UPI0031F4E8A0